MKASKSSWIRVELPNIPNPWKDLLSGRPMSSVKIATWCDFNFDPGTWYKGAYNVFYFKNPDDATMFALSWL